MIDLTPLEVRQKKGDFRRSFRGYDVELVNDFLDLTADRMEELVRQNMELGESLQSTQGELEEYRQKERALSDALMTAQKLREDARIHADKEGELLVREARLAAESARQEASKALAREEETLRQVRARRGQLVQSFRRLLERELGELAVIEETLALEQAAGRAGGRTAASDVGAGVMIGGTAGDRSGANSPSAARGAGAGEKAAGEKTAGEKPAGEKAAGAKGAGAKAAGLEGTPPKGTGPKSVPKPGADPRQGESDEGPRYGASEEYENRDEGRDEKRQAETEIQEDWLESLVEE